MTIEKISSVTEVLFYVNEEQKHRTTIFFDIDDTLIRSKGNFPCPNINFRRHFSLALKEQRWRTYKGKFMSHYNSDYIDLVRDYNDTVLDRKWELTEPEHLPSMFKAINMESYHYYFLTARGVELHYTTKAWLKRLRLYPKPGNRMYRKDCYDIPNITDRSGVRGNIIYAGGYDKCQLLVDASFQAFPNVVMVDDSLSNLESFDRYFSNNELVKFVGLHYENNV